MAKSAKGHGLKKHREGVVTSDVTDKTIVVRVERKVQHPLYKKVMRRTKKYHVHDPKNEAKAGDHVRIVEARPMSRLKRWRLVEVVGRRNEDGVTR